MSLAYMLGVHWIIVPPTVELLAASPQGTKAPRPPPGGASVGARLGASAERKKAVSFAPTAPKAAAASGVVAGAQPSALETSTALGAHVE